MTDIHGINAEWVNWQQLERDPQDHKILLLDSEEDLRWSLSLFTRTIPLSWTGDARYLNKTPLWERNVLYWPSLPQANEEILVLLQEAHAQAEVVYCHEEEPHLSVGSIIEDADADVDPNALIKRIGEYVSKRKISVREYLKRTKPKDEESRHNKPWVPPVRNNRQTEIPGPDDWPDPVDIFKKSSLPALRQDMLPPGLWPYIEDQSELLGSAPDILALSCLFAAGACIHDDIRLQPKRHDYSWTEPARLWAAFVGDPSIKKTPTLRRAVGHLTAIDARLAEQSETLYAKHAEEVEQYKDARLRAKKAGLAMPTKPVDPPRLRLTIEDFTLEAMGGLLQHNPRGMVAKFDELASFFGQMDAYRTNGSGKDRAAWLEAYNGGRKSIDRVGKGAVRVPNWSMRVIGGIQPKSIADIAHKLPEDGLLQRFMIVCAPPNPGSEQDRRPDEDAKHAYKALLDGLWALEPSDHPVTLSVGAHDVRRDFEEERKLLMGLASVPSQMLTALGKWDGTFCRLLLVYHAIECVQAKVHPVNQPVSRDTALRVSRYMMEYLVHHSLHFWTEIMGNNSRMEHSQWIAGHLAQKKFEGGIGDVISSRDLSRAYKKWGALPVWLQADSMRILEDAAWVTPLTVLGRRVTQWAINPKVAEKFADLGKMQSLHRGAIREQMVKLAESRSAEPERETER